MGASYQDPLCFGCKDKQNFSFTQYFCANQNYSSFLSAIPQPSLMNNLLKNKRFERMREIIAKKYT